MEIDNNPLDKILKEQLEHFSPDVPVHVFGKLKAKLPNHQNSSIFSKAVHVIKHAGIGAKIAIAMVVFIPFVLISIPDKKEAKQSSAQSSASQNINQISASTLEADSPITSEPFKRNDKEVFEKKSITTKKPNIQKAEPLAVSSAQSDDKLVLDLQSTSALFNAKETDSKELTPNEIQENASVPSLEPIEENRQIEPLVIPNAFSPNSDGLNDEFEIVMGQTQFYRLRIYSLKGQLIFESDKQNQHWKGTSQENGQALESGSYRYILEYQLKDQSKPSIAVGYIYLNR